MFVGVVSRVEGGISIGRGRIWGKLRVFVDAGASLSALYTTVLKELDIIINANEQYFEDLDGMKNPPKVQKSFDKLTKSNIDAISVIQYKVNDAFCRTGVAHRSKQVWNRIATRRTTNRSVGGKACWYHDNIKKLQNSKLTKTRLWLQMEA